MNRNNILTLMLLSLLLVVFSVGVYAADCDGDGIDDGTNITCNVTVSETLGIQSLNLFNFLPMWENNQTSIPSGSGYFVGQERLFNVTWFDYKIIKIEGDTAYVEQTPVDTVIIEHNFTTGSSTVVNDTITTNDGYVYYFNVSDLPPGTYVWKEYANDTDNEWNVTNNNAYWFYSVADLNWSDSQTLPVSNSTYVQGEDYSFQIKWQGSISDVIFESNINGTLMNYTLSGIYVSNWNKTVSINNDTSGNYWLDFTDLPAGTYSYRWLASDTNGFWISTATSDYIIAKIPTTVSFSITPSVTTPSTTVLMGCSISPAANLSLVITLGGTICGPNNNSISCDVTSPSTESIYTYICNFYGSENYSADYESRTLEVAEADWGDYTPGSSSSQDTSTGAFTITPSDSKVTVAAGSSKEITFTLKNTRPVDDIMDISITVSGISPDWFDLDKTTIDKLRHGGGSETIKMTLNIPENASQATYNMRVKATGEDIDGDTSMIQTSPIQLTVTEPEEEGEIVEAVLTTQETAPTNETEEEGAPTGFLPLVSQYFPYLVLIVGTIAAILIFVKRNDITYNLMKFSGTKPSKKKIPKKSKKAAKKKAKKPSFMDFDWKLSIGLKKEKKPKTLEIPETEREEELEREIGKDIKELKNILESEKRIKKRRK